ncbi:MAG: methyltransferase domain-containing protein [Acidobacteriota bacterium]
MPAVPAARAPDASRLRPATSDDRARANRRRWLRRTSRRLVGRGLRGRVGDRLWRDDAANLAALAFDRAGSRAVCPICGWHGVFLRHAGRRRQICLACGSRARHRTLHLALHRRAESQPQGTPTVGLWIAAESCLEQTLRGLADRWIRGDLRPQREDDLGLDLRRLPFADGSLDRLVANHVLEHVVEDRSALAEIHRVLRPGGLAVLMVPVVAAATVDWGRVDPSRNDHARDCGRDYFDRYRQAGFEVEIVRSDALPDPHGHALHTEDGRQTLVHHVPLCRKPG